MDKPTIGTVSDFLMQFLATCEERDLGPRFFIISVASNDTVQVLRATPDGNIEPWVERGGSVMKLPISVAAINPERGRSIIARIDGEGIRLN